MYTCPMHPEIRQDNQGRCPKCGMALIQEGTARLPSTSHSEAAESYQPLAVIIGLISLAMLAVAVHSWLGGSLSVELAMRTFMAGFFLVFAGFKLIDLHGFAQGYFTYDLLAKRWFGYGYVYPFLELGLGLAYLTNIAPVTINMATFILLSFSGVGVAQKLLRHERIQCACLGTFLKVPLTTVTLIEDFGMAVMALFMLVLVAV